MLNSSNHRFLQLHLPKLETAELALTSHSIRASTLNSIPSARVSFCSHTITLSFYPVLITALYHYTLICYSLVNVFQFRIFLSQSQEINSLPPHLGHVTHLLACHFLTSSNDLNLHGVLKIIFPFSDLQGEGFPGGSEVKASACNVGDLDSILGSGRSPGEGTGNPLQYSCLENPMDGEAWWAIVHRVAKSRTQLSDFTFTFKEKLHFLTPHILHRGICNLFGILRLFTNIASYLWV